MSLQPNQKEAIRSKLLQALGGETQSGARNKISDAIAEVARQYTDEGRYCEARIHIHTDDADIFPF